MPQTEFDVIVLGAGPVGEVIASRTAAAGLSTVVVERELVGGECSYWACIPSKTMLRPGSVLDMVKAVPGVRDSVKGGVDPEAVFAFRKEAVSDYNDKGQVDWLNSEKVALVRGEGRLDGERRVVVKHDGTETLLTANKAVVVATGSSPVKPPIEGLDAIDTWDSRKATSAETVPRRLAILGGGVVACEMAQAWYSFGSAVTVIVRGSRLLEREEPFAGEELAKSFEKRGITVLFATETKSVQKTASGIELSLGDGSTVVADELLVATGRRSNTATIGLDTVGLPADKPLTVDDSLRATGVDGDWLYAVGDVNGRALLTHQGKYQARLCSDAIAGKQVEAWSDHHAVPGVVFTDPEVASVGKRLADAIADGTKAKELKVSLMSTAGAYVNGSQEGTAQLVIDEDKQIVIGATFTGPDVAEMLQSATIAIVGKVPIERLWHAVPAFPTVSEVWLRLLESYGL